MKSLIKSPIKTLSISEINESVIISSVIDCHLKSRLMEMGLVVGKEAMRVWWQDAFDRLPTLHYKVTSLTANSDRVFMEYTRQVANEDDMLVAEVLEIKDEKIVFSRVYHG